MGLTPDERRLCEEIEGRRDQLVALASDLIAFDTTARKVGDPPRDETALQEHLAGRLRRVGAEVDLWEPDAASMRGRPLVPDGLDFAGRPQLIARLRGAGGGQALVFNGHIDVVSAEPRGRWSNRRIRIAHPFVRLPRGCAVFRCRWRLPAPTSAGTSCWERHIPI